MENIENYPKVTQIRDQIVNGNISGQMIKFEEEPYLAPLVFSILPEEYKKAFLEYCMREADLEVDYEITLISRTERRYSGHVKTLEELAQIIRDEKDQMDTDAIVSETVEEVEAYLDGEDVTKEVT